MHPPPNLPSLPPDLAHLILAHLSTADLSATAAVSTACCALAHDDRLWRRHLHSPCPSGVARRHVLRDRAWHRGRAMHLVIPAASAHPAVHLRDDGDIIVATVPSSFSPPSSILSSHPPDPDTFHSPILDVERPPRLHVLAVPPCDAVALSACAQAPIAGSIMRHHPSDRSTVNMHSLTPNGNTHLLPWGFNNTSGIRSVSVGVVNADVLTLAAGRSDGSVIICTNGTTSSTTSCCTHGVQSISICGRGVLVGSRGGEVVAIDVCAPRAQRRFVGPCSCAVSALAAGPDDVVIAGYSHAVAGNGHSAMGVAWDVRCGERIAAFGRMQATSSSALPGAAVMGVAAGQHARRVGLLVGGEVYVFDMRMWECVVHARFADAVDAMDLNDGRLAALAGEQVHVLDFSAAARRRPEDVEWFGAKR